MSLIVHPVSETVNGVGIASPPFEVLTVGSSPEALGTAVVAALGESRTEVAHPTDFPAIARPLYEAAGVKSWSTFVKGSSMCTVEVDGSTLRIEPWENQGAREGFEPILENRLALPASSSIESLGLAVLDALKIAERAGER
jgi:hypothetical protein